MSAKGSIFPSDETIYERSKKWSTFMSRMVTEEDYKSMHFDEIPTDDAEDDSESETKENSPVAVNNCQALVRVNNFEGSSTSDEYDVNDLLNETLPEIEERKRKWKESGMDRVLDTFDVNAITDKVGSWLRKSKLEKSVNSSVEEEQIMHFENHQIHFNSDESLQSADTAKYILSNRKPRATSCTTMTIKRFRYVKGKQKELDRKYNHFDKFDVNHEFGEVFSRLPAIKSRTSARAMSEVDVRPKLVSNLKPQLRSKTYEDSLGYPNVKNIDKPKPESVKRRKSLHRKRRSDISRKRSLSSSSSGSSTPDCNSSYTKPRFRRVLRKSKKSSEPIPSINLTLLSTSSDCELSSKEIVAPAEKPVPIGNLPKSAVNPIQNKVVKAANETCFLPENIVNSTAVSKPDPLENAKNCILSPISSNNVSKSFKTPKRTTTAKCKNLFTNRQSVEKPLEDEPAMTTEKELTKLNSASESQDSDRKVLVYTPGNNTKNRENISGGSFKLTEDHLRKAIGKKASRRFLTLNPQKFPLEFDSASTVYYKLPNSMENTNRSDSTDDSDEDILEIFGKQGELVAEPSPIP